TDWVFGAATACVCGSTTQAVATRTSAKARASLIGHSTWDGGLDRARPPHPIGVCQLLTYLIRDRRMLSAVPLPLLSELDVPNQIALSDGTLVTARIRPNVLTKNACEFVMLVPVISRRHNR